jgi:hypothetical protein
MVGIFCGNADFDHCQLLQTLLEGTFIQNHTHMKNALLFTTLILFLSACHKHPSEPEIELENKAQKNKPDARLFAKKIIPLHLFHEFQWDGQIPLYANDTLIGVKVNTIEKEYNRIRYLVIRCINWQWNDAAMHDMQLNGGSRTEISQFTSLNLITGESQTKRKKKEVLEKAENSPRGGTEKMSLISPGGLPLITVVASTVNGSIERYENG